MKKILVYFLFVLLLASCEERSDRDLPGANNDFIVVDGIITNEFKSQTITLSKPVRQLNEKPLPLSGAIVQVTTELQVFGFHEDSARPGTYVSDTLFSGIRNRTYSLLITSGSTIYSAKAILEPPVLQTEFIPITVKKNVDDNLYRITNIPSNYNPQSYAMYEVLLDWSSVPGYENTGAGMSSSKLYYYTLPTIDVSEVFAPEIEDVTFPAGTVLTQRRYSLTTEHAAFLRAFLLETTWTGGYFNTAPANIPTNMSAGAFGFFGACGVMERVEVVK